MSFNDSFIKEVSEEVRRDNFFKYIKKYAWICILLVLMIVSAVSFNEWNKNNEKINNQSNGDELSLVLDMFIQDKNYNDYFSYIEQKKSGSILAALNPVFLNDKVEIDLIQIIKTLWVSRLFIIKTSLVFLLIGVFVSLASPVIYSSSTTFIPETNQMSGFLISLFIQNLQSLNSLFSFPTNSDIEESLS